MRITAHAHLQHVLARAESHERRWRPAGRSRTAAQSVAAAQSAALEAIEPHGWRWRLAKCVVRAVVRRLARKLGCCGAR